MVNDIRKKKIRRPFVMIHECKSCGNKWDAPFEVKHCNKCGIDERIKGPKIAAIKRTKVFLIEVAEGDWKIPLTVVQINGKNQVVIDPDYIDVGGING